MLLNSQIVVSFNHTLGLVILRSVSARRLKVVQNISAGILDGVHFGSNLIGARWSRVQLHIASVRLYGDHRGDPA